MRYLLLIPGCLWALMILAGCETFTRPTQRIQLQRDSVVLVDTVATRRGTYLVRQGDGNDARWMLVAEPPPDAAMASAVQAAAEVAGKAAANSSGEASITVTQTLTKLVERTQAITILRDSLYRLSEAYANGTIDKATYAAKFGEVLAVAERIARTQELAEENEKQRLGLKRQIINNMKLSPEERFQQLNQLD